MQLLLRWSDRIDTLNNWIGRLLMWSLLIMTLLGVYNAVTRKLSQTIGVDLSSNAYLESQWYLFSLVFLLGGAYALQQGAHVRVDVLYSRLSRNKQIWVDILGTLLFLIPFCILLIRVSIPYALDSWKIMEQSPDPNGLPRYLIKSVIPIAGLLLLLSGLGGLVRNIARLRGILPNETAATDEEPPASL